MWLMGCRLFFCSGLSRRSASAAVVAHIGLRQIVYDRLLVAIGDGRTVVDVVHRAVVEECPVCPVAALVADAGVAEAIHDSTIEANLRTPVASTPEEGAIAITPSPIARSPEQTDRRQNPRARHPEIIVITPSPVAWRPNVTGTNADRLLVHRQGRRSDNNSYGNLCERRRWYSQHHKGQQQRRHKNDAETTHFAPPLRDNCFSPTRRP